MINIKDPFTIYMMILLILVLILIFNKSKYIENFMFTPWNMGTRFYPSYDIRGYPQIYPWNYPFPGIPFLYWSPYFYEADGKYFFNPKYAKALNNANKNIL